MGSTGRTALPAPVPASPSSEQPEGSPENAHSTVSVLGLKARWLLVTQDGIGTPNQASKTLGARSLCSPPRLVSESPACPLATPYSGLNNWTTDDSEDTEIRPPWALHMLCPLGGTLRSIHSPPSRLATSRVVTQVTAHTFLWGNLCCLSWVPPGRTAVVHASPAFSAAVTA